MNLSGSIFVYALQIKPIITFYLKNGFKFVANLRWRLEGLISLSNNMNRILNLNQESSLKENHNNSNYNNNEGKSIKEQGTEVFNSDI